MLSRVSKWGNSQGVRISKKLLQSVQIGLDDEVEIFSKNGELILAPTGKKSLTWYLDSYGDDHDRYDWGESNEPQGRELL